MNPNIKIVPVGKPYKNDVGEMCLKSIYNIEVTLKDLTHENLQEKFEEASKKLSDYFESQFITT